MLKKTIVFLVTLLVVSAFAYAQERFSVSGVVIFSGDDDIHVSLLTYEAFKNYKLTYGAYKSIKERPPAPFTQIFKANPERKKTGRTPFKFVGVPKGSYCINSFLDENKNGKIHYIYYLATEPECWFKDFPMGSPSWVNVKFEVDKDITGIKIEFE